MFEPLPPIPSFDDWKRDPRCFKKHAMRCDEIIARNRRATILLGTLAAIAAIGAGFVIGALIILRLS